MYIVDSNKICMYTLIYTTLTIISYIRRESRKLLNIHNNYTLYCIQFCANYTLECSVAYFNDDDYKSLHFTT